MAFDYKARLKGLRAELKKISLDAILITNEINVTYLSGFRGSDSLIVVTPDSQFFLTDSRYIEEAGSSISGFTVIEIATSAYDVIANIVKKNRIKKLGFESMCLPHHIAVSLGKKIRPVRAVGTQRLVEKLRTIKDAREIECIKRSIRVTRDVLERTVKTIRPGVSEISLSDRIEYEFIKRGARIAFGTIAAHGRNCSKPHAHPTAEKIAKNDAVMLDMGCRLDLYNSDITRMIFLGKVRDKIKEIYEVVSSAQKAAIEKIRPGVKISEVDAAARNYIAARGYGKFFGHSLGHGVGMEVHEEPSISGRNGNILKAGMVFTVEPAIYLPKFGGVRIEDMVLVTDKGCEVLTR